DADLTHVGRQPWLRDGDSILYLHLRDVEVGAELKAYRDGETPVGSRVRRDIQHVVDAVDLLLDRCDHGGGNDVGISPWILAGHIDDRRRDLGILRDRQTGISDRSQNNEDDRDHAGEDRTLDEEMR